MSSHHVKGIYKQLLRYGRTLTYTDKDYFYRRIRYSMNISYCEAQGKGRAKGQPRKVTKRSFKDGGWWMVVVLSLMLYIKFGCVTFPPPPTHPYFSKSP